jgi:hypothetical protein
MGQFTAARIAAAAGTAAAIRSTATNSTPAFGEAELADAAAAVG